MSECSSLAYTQFSTDMPPKGSKKSFAQRGSVVPNGSGFRAQAYIAGRTQRGPTRATEAEANCDLRESRDAASETEYSSVLQRLVTDSHASNAVVNVPADVSAEPLRKRLRTKSSSAPDSSAPKSKNSVRASSSSHGLCRPELEADGAASVEVPAEASAPSASSSGLCREGSAPNLAQSLCLRGLTSSTLSHS